MTLAETNRVMAVLWAAYPQFYAKASRGDLDAAVKLWQTCFSQEPYGLVEAGVYALIKTRVSSFPPSIGEVTQAIQSLTASQEMTELEAWDLVHKAVRNSTWNAREEFDKLPPTIQAVVHSPEQLREWAAMEADTVGSVVASNFQRSYRAKIKQEKDWAALPPVVREYAGMLQSGQIAKRLEE